MNKLEFSLGCGLEEYKKYYLGTRGPLGEDEEGIIQKNPEHLIIWKKDDKIIGHALWHAASTREHHPEDPRDQEDRKILENLLGGEKKFIELHEVWLKKEERGKGYGNQFFDFFEKFITDQGYQDVIYYAYDTAAIGLCRQRGYKELAGFEGEDLNQKVFFHVYAIQL